MNIAKTIVILCICAPVEGSTDKDGRYGRAISYEWVAYQSLFSTPVRSSLLVPPLFSSVLTPYSASSDFTSSS